MQAFFTKHAFLILGLFFLFTYSSVVSGERAEAVPAAPELRFVVTGDAPAISATAYAVFDVSSGEVLVSHNTDAVLPIASVTKLATAAAVLEDSSLDTELEIRSSDTDAEGRAGKLALGDTYTPRELLFPLLLESSNDAAEALLRGTESDLVSAMNDMATEVGMRNTSFADASGLSDRNVSTVADIQVLLSHLVEEHQHVLDITQLEDYVGPHTSLMNNSPVQDESYVGGKHGFTEAADRTLAALFSEEISGVERTLGYVLLGSEDLRTDTATLRAFVHDSVRFE